jgi:hypothetical protein
MADLREMFGGAYGVVKVEVWLCYRCQAVTVSWCILLRV